MLNQPTSSPMMTRMFGFRGCCAEAGAFATIIAVSNVSRPIQISLAIFMICFLTVGCPEMGRQPAPDYSHAEVFGEQSLTPMFLGSHITVPRGRKRRQQDATIYAEFIYIDVSPR